LAQIGIQENPQSAIRNPQSAIRNFMNDTALASLQRSLSEYREAKRKTKTRLAEIEAEAEMLRSQLATIDAIIGQTEVALRKVLFPTDSYGASGVHDSRPDSRADSRPDNRSVAYEIAPYRPSEAEIEDEVAKLRRSEETGNVRFNDFRIPQAATIILREASSALHVSEIYRRMAEGGFEFRGQHQLITLAVSLSRSKRFRKVAPGTFELNPEYLAGQVA
jgi:hypothetical protein